MTREGPERAGPETAPAGRDSRPARHRPTAAGGFRVTGALFGKDE